MKLVRAVLLPACLVAATGCYKTEIRSPQTPREQAVHYDRQWFTIGGLVGLSGPAGDECGSRGIARSESKMGGADILINLGLVVAGAVVGASVCDPDGDAEEYSSCVSLTTGLGPFLLATRTLEYECVAEAPVSQQPATLAPAAATPMARPAAPTNTTQAG